MGEALRDAFDPRKTVTAGPPAAGAGPVTDPKGQTP